MKTREITDRILQLKKEKRAVILAHYYARPEIQDVADYLGDSLGLSQAAGNTDADIIVFCGVQFMAETAAIISPQKKVLVPVWGAGCSLAESIRGEDLKQWKAAHPDSIVVSYVNTTAEVKAWTDICCTSANALKVVESLPADKAPTHPEVRNKHCGNEESQADCALTPTAPACPMQASAPFYKSDPNTSPVPPHLYHNIGPGNPDTPQLSASVPSSFHPRKWDADLSADSSSRVHHKRPKEPQPSYHLY